MGFVLVTQEMPRGCYWNTLESIAIRLSQHNSTAQLPHWTKFYQNMCYCLVNLLRNAPRASGSPSIPERGRVGIRAPPTISPGGPGRNGHGPLRTSLRADPGEMVTAHYDHLSGRPRAKWSRPSPTISPGGPGRNGHGATYVTPQCPADQSIRARGRL